MPGPAHIPFTLMPTLRALGLVPDTARWQIYPSPADVGYLHASADCDKDTGPAEIIAPDDLETRLEWEFSEMLCPLCARGVEGFGLRLTPNDVTVLTTIVELTSAMDVRAAQPGPVSALRSTLEHTWASTKADHPAILELHEKVLAQVPAALDRRRATDTYRKELLKACLHGAQFLRNHAEDVTRLSGPGADEHTRLLNALVHHYPSLSNRQLPDAYALDVEADLTSGEAALVDELTTPWAWVALHPLEHDTGLHGFAKDEHNDFYRHLLIPAIILAHRPPSRGFLYTLKAGTTRQEIVTATTLSTADRPWPTGGHDITAMVGAVQAAHL